MQLIATKLVGLRSRVGVISSLQAANTQTEITKQCELMASNPRLWEKDLTLLGSCKSSISCSDL